MKPTPQLKTHRGVIVPMVTPIHPDGALDESATRRIIDFMCAGGVHGIFVLGTTGEALNVPPAIALRLVALSVKHTAGRALVYAGISAASLEDSARAGNAYLKLGVDAVVAHVPSDFEQNPAEAQHFFSALAERIEGDLIVYNMPLTTNVSLPIDVCKATSKRPRVIGIKDSENNGERLVELLRELGGQRNFSVFVGTGPLMAKGLLLGADGIVPSVGNLVPDVCPKVCAAARKGDWTEVGKGAEHMSAVAALYQKGRTLAQSLAAIKGLLHLRGHCSPAVFPPLLPVSPAELDALRREAATFQLP
jgi:4-hydroxy-tetrahydrodipicolinate synthase